MSRGRVSWGVDQFEAVLARLTALSGTRDDALSVLDALFGDKLAEAGSPLAIPMSLRTAQGELDLDAPLATALPEARPHLAVLVHGLMCNERFWFAGAGDSFGERLADDVAVTPVYVRYNSGRHISENGRELAAVLGRLHAAWPVPLESISLIGHSMGGLVCRSATHYARIEREAWLERLERLFLLGVPSRGAPLEQLVNVAAFTLRTVINPWTKLIGWSLNQRSAGIKDLRHGYLVDEEWRGRNVDLPSLGRRHPVPLAAGVRHYVAAGTLATDTGHPLGRIFGDALVTPWSARDDHSDEARAPGPEAAERHVRVFPGLGHLALGHDDEVYGQLRAWW